MPTRTVRRELVSAWVNGWVVSRGVRPAVDIDGGHWVDVGLPGHVSRYVFADADPELINRIVTAPTAPGTWIKVFADESEVAPLLTPGWTISDPGFLMTTDLRWAEALPPRGYLLEITGAGSLIKVRVMAGQDLAARGQIACVGRDAVVDQVVTEPAHQRRGLGSLVMTTLAGCAAKRGAVRGILGATTDGLALYRTLGWSVRAPLTAVVFP